MCINLVKQALEWFSSFGIFLNFWKLVSIVSETLFGINCKWESYIKNNIVIVERMSFCQLDLHFSAIMAKVTVLAWRWRWSMTRVKKSISYSTHFWITETWKSSLVIRFETIVWFPSIENKLVILYLLMHIIMTFVTIILRNAKSE